MLHCWCSWIGNYNKRAAHVQTRCGRYVAIQSDHSYSPHTHTFIGWTTKTHKYYTCLPDISLDLSLKTVIRLVKKALPWNKLLQSCLTCDTKNNNRILHSTINWELSCTLVEFQAEIQARRTSHQICNAVWTLIVAGAVKSVRNKQFSCRAVRSDLIFKLQN